MKKFMFLMACLATLQACNIGYDKTSATIYDYGNPEVDGCGWVIQVGDEIYAPEELDEAFKIDGLEVEITYKKLKENAPCGWIPDAHPYIRIKSME
jgi:hypothetical protein